MLHARPKLGSPGRRKRRLSALSRAACATCGATHLSGAFAERVALARARARGWNEEPKRAKSLYAYLPAARRSGTASPGSCCGPRRRSRHGARRQEHTLGAANPTHGQSLGAPAREGRRGAAARGRQRAPRTAPRCTAARRVARDSCPIWQSLVPIAGFWACLLKCIIPPPPPRSADRVPWITIWPSAGSSPQMARSRQAVPSC